MDDDVNVCQVTIIVLCVVHMEHLVFFLFLISVRIKLHDR